MCFGKNTTEYMSGDALVYLITADINLWFLVKMASARFPPGKVTILLFVLNKNLEEDCLRLCKYPLIYLKSDRSSLF